MNTATLDATLAHKAIGQIAVDLPGATAVFRRLKLDFCCGGQVSLQHACAQKGLDTDAVLAQLAPLQRQEQAAPDARDPAALIDHILTRYHAVHREQLPELVRMARRVEAVHRDHPDVPTGLAALLEQVEQELLDHMAKEEQILFPILKAGGSAMVVYPITMMRMEHTSHGQMLERLGAWRIVGRQEMYVPFHNYRFDDPAITEEQLLLLGHANPDYMRWELRRVWIVEAKLREGFRHIYHKRRFYIEEDSWNMVMTENYDGRGELWKAVLINSLYAYDAEGYEKRQQMFHDLRAGIYNCTRLTNWTRPWNFSAPDPGADFFTVENRRKSGKR